MCNLAHGISVYVRMEQAEYVRIQKFDVTKSRAIQPTWAGPFYLIEDNDSYVKVSKTPFGM